MSVLTAVYSYESKYMHSKTNKQTNKQTKNTFGTPKVVSHTTLIKISKPGVPVMAQWLTNLTRNQKGVGSIPALVQWVNDPALL